jgi:cell division protein FtsB
MKRKRPTHPQLRKSKRWLRLLNNKYAVTAIVLGVWMLFFDSNSVLENLSMHRQINQLHRDARYYEARLVERQQRLLELQTNDENLEKFAREQYLMKRAKEDIFIVLDK